MEVVAGYSNRLPRTGNLKQEYRHDPLLWIAKTGLDAQQTQLDVISNNLANVSTNGVQAFARGVRRPDLPDHPPARRAESTQQTRSASGLQLGTGVRPVATERIHTQGTLQPDRRLARRGDQGKRFFQVAMPDGTTAYTRDGSFPARQHRAMVTASGYPLADGIVIPPTRQSMTIGKDGTVSVTLPGRPRRRKSAHPGRHLRESGRFAGVGENLFGETASKQWATPNQPGSNGAGAQPGLCRDLQRNVAEELVNMIQTQRAYELNSRAVRPRPDARPAHPALRRPHDEARQPSDPARRQCWRSFRLPPSRPPRRPVVHQPMSVRPEAMATASPPTAIYQTVQARPLFEDWRAPHRRHDINLVERNTATKANATRNGNITLDRRHPQPLCATEPASNGLELEHAESDFNGRARPRPTTFNDHHGHRHPGVYPNGNLLVSGEKMIAINQGQRVHPLLPVVNQADHHQPTPCSPPRWPMRAWSTAASGYIDESNTTGCSASSLAICRSEGRRCHILSIPFDCCAGHWSRCRFSIMHPARRTPRPSASGSRLDRRRARQPACRLRPGRRPRTVRATRPRRRRSPCRASSTCSATRREPAAGHQPAAQERRRGDGHLQPAGLRARARQIDVTVSSMGNARACAAEPW